MNNTPVTYSQKLTITILSCILIAVLAYRLSISSDLKKINSLEMEYDTAEMTFDLLNDKINQTPYENLEEVISEYQEFSKDIFEYMNTEELCVSVTDLFLNNSLSIDSLSASEPQPLIIYDAEYDEQIQIDYIYSSMLTISSYGNFRNIINLIDSINEQPSYVIENFGISDSDGSSAKFSIVLNVFMYNDVQLDWGK